MGDYLSLEDRITVLEAVIEKLLTKIDEQSTIIISQTKRRLILYLRCYEKYPLIRKRTKSLSLTP